MKSKDYILGKIKQWEGSTEFRKIELYSINYVDIEEEGPRKLFETFHSLLTWHFENINYRLSKGTYVAEDSRRLIEIINELKNIRENLINLNFKFIIDEYYENIIEEIYDFLQEYWGSTIPKDFEEIKIAETKPIFYLDETINISNQSNAYYQLKQIGEGSYANVSRYKDEFYNEYFVVKRAKKDLNPKEKARFKKEFEVMRSLDSPYILKVYNFNESKYEYTMEYADLTIKDYIEKNNTKIEVSDRIGLVRQVIKGFKYIESKKLLHRDISTTNILLKQYDDVTIIKIADFGLVKDKDSDLTSLNTEFKGSFNDPKLDVIGGFKNYKIYHETYALTRLIYFIMTGRRQTRFDEDSFLKVFVEKGINDDMKKRYRSIEQLRKAFENHLSE